MHPRPRRVALCTCSFVGRPDAGHDAGEFMSEHIEQREIGALGGHVIVLPTCENTQLEAKIVANQGAPHGTLVLAHHQRRGIARHGRTWYSGENGLYFSLVLRPSGLPIAHLARLPLLAGVGLWQGLQNLGVKARIKWPNDILIPHPEPGPLGPYRKVAGCLVQPLLTGQRLDAVILGIGVNVSTPKSGFPKDIRHIAGSLEDAGCPLPKEKVLGHILDGLECWLQNVEHDELFHRALDLVKHNSTTIGQDIEISSSGKIQVGVAEGLDFDGALLLRKRNGDLLRILSGDLRP